MLPGRKSRIVDAFDRAQAYDSHAKIQRVAADRLANRIAALHVRKGGLALEIGCGTGFLSEALVTTRPDLDFTISDVAPAMLARAQRRLGPARPGLAYALIDGERPAAPPAGGWDLVASSLAFQWFEDPAASIATLVDMLAPGGWLAFSTLVAGSFAEWTAALESAGLPGVTRLYPEPEALVSRISGDASVDIETYPLDEVHDNGRAFLRSLKAIGAGTSWDRGANPAALRRAISAFDSAGASIRYNIAQIAVQRRSG